MFKPHLHSTADGIILNKVLCFLREVLGYTKASDLLCPVLLLYKQSKTKSLIKKLHENEADKWIWMKSMVERITSPHHQMSLPSSLEAENMLPNMAKWSLHMWLSEGPCHGEIILDYPSRPNVITGPSGKGGGRGFSVRRERDRTLLLALKWRKEPDAKSAGGL